VEAVVKGAEDDQDGALLGPKRYTIYIAIAM